MKTLKSKFLLPLAVFMVAVVAAFASQAPVEEDLAPVQGYIHSTIPCEISVQCSPTGATVCKYNNKQVFGMNAASQCTRTLYLPIQAN